MVDLNAVRVKQSNDYFKNEFFPTKTQINSVHIHLINNTTYIRF